MSGLTLYNMHYVFHLDVRMSSMRKMFTGLMECVYDMTFEIRDSVLATIQSVQRH